MRKKLIGIVFALVLALTTFTSSALAHECFIVSRSDAGDLAATNSGQWIQVATRIEAFAFLGGFLGLPALSPSQLAWADAEAASAGVPNDLVIFAKFTIAGDSAVDGTNLMSDGKGVDHLFDVLVPIYQQALTK